jgi:hypothetical protein
LRLERTLKEPARRWLTWAALFGCHIALTLYFVRPEVLRSGPIVGADWDMHVQQCARALDAWRGYKKSWGYDPQMLAGSLAGTVFDLNNKMHEIVVVLLTAIRIKAAAAFNIFVLAAHFLVPVVVFASARLFGLSRRGATLAAGLTSALWFFDSSIHWGWWIGSISWTFAAALAQLPVALFYRWDKERTLKRLLVTMVLLIVTLHVHPYTFFLMAPPMLALFVRSLKRGLPARQGALVVCAALITVLANLWWLRVALRFSGYLLDSAYLGATTLPILMWDYFGFLADPNVTGYIAVRTSFRFLALVAAAIGVYRWQRARDDRALVLGIGFLVPFALAYLGGHVHALRQLQPLRFVFAAAFFAAIPAAAVLEEALADFRSWAGAPRERVVLALLGVIALPKLALDVWYYFPTATPAAEAQRAIKGDPIGGAFDNAGLVWPLHRSYAHFAMNEDERKVVDFVREHDDGTGRWLVEWHTLGERLAWATGAQVLGGFPYFNMQHNDANWFRAIGEPRDPATLPAYLESYNVTWLIRSFRINPGLEKPNLFEPAVAIGPHRIYRARRKPSFVIGGGTAKVKASFNRIEVANGSKPPFVLKYHWLDSFACRPNCRVEREPMPADRVGFIRVVDAPADFEIVNAY